jgi:multisubunit Na+/H+ antiporter MnhF subunit
MDLKLYLDIIISVALCSEVETLAVADYEHDKKLACLGAEI